MSVGSRLRERREHADLTLGQVAEYEQIGRQYLSKLELGVNEPPTWPLLAQLARRYNTSADYLLGLTDDPTRREGAAPPPYVVEILELLPELSDARRYELWKIAEALIAVELAQPSSLDQAIAKATGKVKDEPRVIGGTE